MLAGDGAAPTAAPGLSGEGECPSFGGRLLSGLWDMGIVLPGAVLDTLPRKKLLFLFVGGQRILPPAQMWLKPVQVQLGRGPGLLVPVISPCPCPVQAGWAEGMEAEGSWLTQGVRSWSSPSSADRGAGTVVQEW